MGPSRAPQALTQKCASVCSSKFPPRKPPYLELVSKSLHHTIGERGFEMSSDGEAADAFASRSPALIPGQNECAAILWLLRSKVKKRLSAALKAKRWIGKFIST